MDVKCTYKKSIVGDQLLRTQTNTWHRLPGKSNKNVWKFSTDKYFLFVLALFVFFTLFCFFVITEFILNKKQNNQIIE